MKHIRRKIWLRIIAYSRRSVRLQRENHKAVEANGEKIKGSYQYLKNEFFIQLFRVKIKFLSALVD